MRSNPAPDVYRPHVCQPHSRHFYLRTQLTATHLWPMILLLCLSGFANAVRAEVRLLARSGDVATGLALFEQFTAPQLNGQGDLAFEAQLDLNTGGVTSTDDQGIWQTSNAGLQLVARTGSGAVPGVTGADYQQFRSFALSETGSVVIRADMAATMGGVTTNDQAGLWQFGPTSSQLLERTGTTTAAGISNGRFALLDNNPVVSPGGTALLHSRLQRGSTVLSNSDTGVWSYGAGVGQLRIREQTTTPPGVQSAEFIALATGDVSDSGDSLVLGVLDSGQGGVTVQNNLGLWNFASTGNRLLAREGTGNVAGVVGSSYTRFGDMEINANATVAFQATLNHDANINTNNDAGIWADLGQGSTLLLRTGAGGAFGVPGANYSSVASIQLNDSDELLVQAELAVGSGGVTQDNAAGLWLLDTDGSSQALVARTGTGGVEGVPGANFESFSQTSLNQQGDVAVLAELEIGPGGVTAADNLGLWLFDADGGSQLIARTGQDIAHEGTSQGTVTTLGFAGHSNHRLSGLNALGELAYLAGFASGASGIYLHSDSVFATADFNESGEVDDADLLLWQTYFGTASGADANADQHVDGADFLLWQRQHSSSQTAAEAVPEPATAWLVLVAGVGSLFSRKRGSV